MRLLKAIKRKRRLNRLKIRVSQSARNTLPVVIVYQMGKVASSSIYHALKARNDCYGFHTHNLTTTQANDSFWNPNRHNIISVELQKQLLDRKRPLKIVTLVRDPFARNISAYFETSPNIPNKKSSKAIVSELVEDFLQTFNHSICNDWFEKEFRNALGIDIFSHSFDAAIGWSQITIDQIDLLTLKTTLQDNKKRKLIEQFVGIEDLALERINDTREKSINTLYREFKDSIRFPKSIFDAVANDRFTTHFFTELERQEMRKRWCEI